MRIIGWLLAILSFGTVPTYACTMNDQFMRPSTFELVSMSDVIVIGTPLGLATSGQDNKHSGHAIVTIDQILKGKELPAQLKLNLKIAGDTHGSNSCEKGPVKKGMPYVLFLT